MKKVLFTNSAIVSVGLVTAWASAADGIKLGFSGFFSASKRQGGAD